MKNLLYIFLFLWGVPVFSQPLVDICLNNTGTTLEVIITPDGSFQGVVSNIQFTIKSADPTVTFGSPVNSFGYITMAKAGAETTVASDVYHKFAGFGFVNMSFFTTTWAANTAIILCTITPSSLATTFEIADDSWTSINNGDYYAELNGLEKTGVIGSCGALAVDGLTLTAQHTGDRKVMLQWETLAEYNSSHFELEKKAETGEFEVINRQEAAGLSSTPLAYKHLDASPMSRTNYYRVREVGLNGQSTFSNTVEVTFDRFPKLSVWPNPSTGLVNFEAYGIALEQISLYDALGRAVLIQERIQDNGPLSLDISALPQGIYHYQGLGDAYVWEGSLVKW